MSTTARTRRRRSTLAAIGASSIAAIAASPAGAQAPAPTLTIFHNLDFIAVGGFADGESLTISVTRPNLGVVGTVTAPAREGEVPGEFGLELNHGPEAAPLPGDCWDGPVPDILPGDTVTVSGDTIVHSDVVDDIQITTGMFAVGQDVAYEGYALDATGAPIPIAALDSGEVRAEDANPERVRATPTRVEAIPGVPGGFRAIHERSANYGAFRGEDQTLDYIRNALLSFGDPAMGYGHIEVPPPFAQIVDGVSGRQFGRIAGGGPALGCDAAVFERNSIETTSPTTINATNVGAGIVVNGKAATDVTAADDVDILVDGSAVDAVVTVNPGARTWRATIPATAIPATDAPLRIEADFPGSEFDTIDGAYISTVELPKDLAAPSAPTANPAGGTYVGTQQVTLTAEEGATIRYTNDGADPTSTSLVANGPIAVTATQTLKAIAIDAAGNASGVTVLNYTITSPPGAGGGDGGGGGGGAAATGAGLTTGTTIGADAGASDAPAAQASAVKAPLGITALIASKSIKRSKARIQGLRLTLRIVPGTEVVRFRIYRKLRNGARVLLTSGFRAPAAAGFYRATLKDPVLRRKLTPGNYEVEVTPGASQTDLGTSRRHAFKVTRR